MTKKEPEKNIVDNNHVALERKYSLTINQASEVFNIGHSKIRYLVDNEPYAKWHYRNGNRVMIKRELFEEWLDDQCEI